MIQGRRMSLPKDPIETLKGLTFVVKTHKEYGYHFYILTPVFHEPIGSASFKLGAEIEIKTDMSLGTMHLPPSRHRNYNGIGIILGLVRQNEST